MLEPLQRKAEHSALSFHQATEQERPRHATQEPCATSGIAFQFPGWNTRFQAKEPAAGALPDLLDDLEELEDLEVTVTAVNKFSIVILPACFPLSVSLTRSALMIFPFRVQDAAADREAGTAAPVTVQPGMPDIGTEQGGHLRQGRNALLHLPEDLLLRILGGLSVQDILRCGQSCSSLHA